MEIRARAFFVSFLVCAIFVACVSENKEKSHNPQGSWPEKMQGMAKEVRELIPYLYSRQAFNSSENRKKIQSAFKAFQSQSHSVSPEMGEKFFGEDPLVRYSLKNLNEDIQRASEAFDLGQLEYSRGVGKAVVGHCFRCHSMTKVGSQAQWTVSGIPNLNLTPVERSDLLVATRKYDEAIEYLEGLLLDRSFIQNSPFDFEALLRKYMSLMIRVERSPEATLQEIEKILQIKEVPFYIAEQAKAWRQSLLAWKVSSNKKTSRDLLAQAIDRIQKATEAQQYARDHAGDVEYLRATTILHEYLKGSPGQKNLAKAYYLLGQAYEVLDDLGSWNLHETYYESCIRTSPKTSVARNCYRRLEASIYLGFSGSSGVHIPTNERLRLKELKELTL